MKMYTLIKTATLATLMAMGTQGMAQFKETTTITGSTLSGNRVDSASSNAKPNVLFGDGSVRSVRAAEKPRYDPASPYVATAAIPAKSRRGTPGSIARDRQDHEAALLLPAVQAAREAAR